jgi:hypothetical protein
MTTLAGIVLDGALGYVYELLIVGGAALLITALVMKKKG